ncbi:MAG TPA: MOSC N-terminal beta barrel domain-containing protein [Acidimicrobiales bacterium]|nr:MOSC N-terminal beta barrel domain-containing protein [Acidimicrobiales bacterium]
MNITELWRYPVKSMQGERLDSVQVTAGGLTGDRAFALVDTETGFVVSAKHPRKWRQILHCHAALDDAGVATITLPDGSTTRSDAPDVDARLSAVFGRDVTLASNAPDDRHYEMLFPDIEGVAPQEAIDDNRIGDEPDGTLADMGLGLLAPPTSFFDLTALHLVTSATLAAVGQPVRRFRPNVVVDADGVGYVENGWAGRSVALGATTQAQVLIPTMRCVMTTLAQPGLDADRGVLQTLARENRIEIPGVGTWACAGVYATVTAPGDVAVGDAVTVS